MASKGEIHPKNWTRPHAVPLIFGHFNQTWWTCCKLTAEFESGRGRLDDETGAGLRHQPFSEILKRRIRWGSLFRVEFCRVAVAEMKSSFSQINGRGTSPQRSALTEKRLVRSSVSQQRCSFNKTAFVEKPWFGLKASVLCALGPRTLSSPLYSITAEIRCVIMISLPFPVDKGVNECLYTTHSVAAALPWKQSVDISEKTVSLAFFAKDEKVDITFMAGRHQIISSPLGGDCKQPACVLLLNKLLCLCGTHIMALGCFAVTSHSQYNLNDQWQDLHGLTVWKYGTR